MERRSISITPELHSRILKFRAFFLSHGIDVDYTEAINFLASRGYEGLMKSGFDESLLAHFHGKGSSDETIRNAISSDWRTGRMPGIPSLDAKARTEGSQVKAVRTVQSRGSGIAKLKAASSFCVKCRALRKIKDPHIEMMKNGREAVLGTCPVCGSKMVHFGIQS